MPDSERPLLDTKGLCPAIWAVVSLFEAANALGALIGAAAVGLVNEARLTRDVDALVILDGDQWAGFLEQAAQFHLTPRVDDCLKFARRSRVLLLYHQPSNVDVDISLGALPFEEELIARVRRVNIGGLQVPVATPEDLIVMKAVAGRAKDMVDIAALIEADPRIDLERVRHWTKLFAETMETPEMMTRLEEVLGRTASTHKTKRPSKRNSKK